MGNCLPKPTQGTQGVAPTLHTNPLHAWRAPRVSPTVFVPCDEELLLRITTCLAQNGYHTEVGVMVRLNKRFWRDEQIWDAFKDVPGPGGRTHLMYASWHGRTKLYAAKQGFPTRLEWLLARGARINAAAGDGMTALMHASKKGNVWSAVTLIDRRADLEARNSAGFTPLMVACSPSYMGFFNSALIGLLVKRGANVNAASDDGTTPLMCVLKYGTVFARFFLTNGANANAKTHSGESVLIKACLTGDLSVVRLLFEKEKGLDVHAVDEKGYSAFFYACNCYRGNEKMVRLLLDQGALIDTVYPQGMTALMMASYRCNLGVVRVLLERGAAATLTSHDGSNALTLCCELSEYPRNGREKGMKKSSIFFNLAWWRAQQPYVKICRLLVARGVDVNSFVFGRSALMSVSLDGNLSIARTLIKLGADVNASDTLNGLTALMGASKNGHLKMANFLIDRGADVNATAVATTPLISACDGGHVDVVRALIVHGANVNATRLDGFNALMAACEKGNVEIVQLLLILGANVDAVMNDGSTALMLVSQNGFSEVARLLITNGANVDATNVHNSTALTLARENGHVNIALLLLQRGASENFEDPLP